MTFRCDLKKPLLTYLCVCTCVLMAHVYVVCGMLMYVQRAGRDVRCPALSPPPYFVDVGSLTEHECWLQLLLELQAHTAMPSFLRWFWGFKLKYYACTASALTN